MESAAITTRRVKGIEFRGGHVPIPSRDAVVGAPRRTLFNPAARITTFGSRTDRRGRLSAHAGARMLPIARAAVGDCSCKGSCLCAILLSHSRLFSLEISRLMCLAFPFSASALIGLWSGSPPPTAWPQYPPCPNRFWPGGLTPPHSNPTAEALGQGKTAGFPQIRIRPGREPAGGTPARGWKSGPRP